MHLLFLPLLVVVVLLRCKNIHIHLLHFALFLSIFVSISFSQSAFFYSIFPPPRLSDFEGKLGRSRSLPASSWRTEGRPLKWQVWRRQSSIGWSMRYEEYVCWRWRVMYSMRTKIEWSKVLNPASYWQSTGRAWQWRRTRK